MTKELENRLRVIEERNTRVENDKQWETSYFRKALITSVTYVSASLFLVIIDADKPFLGALVPAVGYFLSTLAINPIKQWWLRK